MKEINDIAAIAFCAIVGFAALALAWSVGRIIFGGL